MYLAFDPLSYLVKTKVLPYWQRPLKNIGPLNKQLAGEAAAMRRGCVMDVICFGCQQAEELGIDSDTLSPIFLRNP